MKELLNKTPKEEVTPYYVIFDESSTSSSLYGGSTLEKFGSGRIYYSPFMQILLMHKVVELVESNSVLVDLGCGTADLAWLFYVNRKSVKYIGIEINEKSIQRSLTIIEKLYNSKNYDAILLQRDLTKGIPLKDGSVDFVSCILMLEHVPKERGIFLLKEIHRVLKKGGRAFIVTPDRGKTIAPYHVYEWRSSKLINVITSLKFEIIDSWYSGSTIRQIEKTWKDVGIYQLLRNRLPKTFLRLFLSPVTSEGHDIVYFVRKLQSHMQ